MGYLKVYTEKAVEEIYPNSLSNSVHFALSEDGVEFHPLNQGYGILFAEAAIRPDNTIEELGIRNPVVYSENGKYFVAAGFVDACGKPVKEDRRVRWSSQDFLTFSEQENVPAERIPGKNVPVEEASEEACGCRGPEKRSCIIALPDELCQKIKDRWMPLEAIKAEVETPPLLDSMEDVEQIHALVTYSDGSVDRKKVIWDKDGIEETDSGHFRIRGKIGRVDTGFPLAVGYADPVVFFWEGAWYFLATNDNVDDVGLFVRKADSVAKLFDEATEEYCILDYDEEKGFCQTFWAPEFHVIGGRLYILFAVSSRQWGPQCHMMRLKEGGSIIAPDDWEEPIRVCRRDGTPLAPEGITLDMTYFHTETGDYLCWSYRYGIGTPADTGSMLYIATTQADTPWKLTSEPVLLSRPLYGWENNSGTINNEGPYPLILGDQIYLAYSGGAACGYSYVVGFLTAHTGEDLLDVKNWEKTPTPAFHSLSVEGIQGPGHNSFFVDESGRLMIAYHGQEREKYFKRCTAIHRVHISKAGIPLLNVAGERDVPASMEEIEATFGLKQ